MNKVCVTNPNTGSSPSLSVIRTQSKEKSWLIISQNDLVFPKCPILLGVSLKNFCSSETHPEVLSPAKQSPPFLPLTKDFILENFSFKRSYYTPRLRFHWTPYCSFFLLWRCSSFCLTALWPSSKLYSSSPAHSQWISVLNHTPTLLQ